MKLTLTLCALAFCGLLTGCDTPTPALLSLEPVVATGDTATDGALPGTWETPGDKGLLAVIHQDDHGGYQILVIAGNAPMSFQAQLFRIGDAEFLDVTPTDDSDFRIPGHAVARIWTNGGSLRWAFLDSPWLQKRAAALAAHQSDGKTLLFSPTAAVFAFLSSQAIDDQAYGKVATWVKTQ